MYRYSLFACGSAGDILVLSCNGLTPNACYKQLADAARHAALGAASMGHAAILELRYDQDRDGLQPWDLVVRWSSDEAVQLVPETVEAARMRWLDEQSGEAE
ncbi:hypothetical protein [Armatimonas sp.]|uniref:hypothetical protein n=1 Tax=Armatimonas sp. TaxID=1872638 RepID=UPI00374FE189